MSKAPSATAVSTALIVNPSYSFTTQAYLSWQPAEYVSNDLSMYQTLIPFVESRCGVSGNITLSFRHLVIYGNISKIHVWERMRHSIVKATLKLSWLVNLDRCQELSA